MIEEEEGRDGTRGMGVSEGAESIRLFPCSASRLASRGTARKPVVEIALRHEHAVVNRRTETHLRKKVIAIFIALCYN